MSTLVLTLAAPWQTLRQLVALADRVVTAILRRWPVLLCGLYLAAGVLFDTRGTLTTDGVSRVYIASSVIDGFDPGGAAFLGLHLHAAAIGFVWGPLVSGLEVPLIAIFQGWFPWIVKSTFVGAMVDAPFIAWAAYQLDRLLAENGSTRHWRFVLVAGFALNPFILIYAANGMSEAPYVALMVAAARYLSIWQREGRTSALALAGVWLGLDYLVRYETPAAGAGGALFIMLFAGAHTNWTSSRQFRRATVDVMIFVLPLIFSILVFSGISWWITGSALAQFSSQYGNSAQAAAAGLTATPVSHLSLQLLMLAPVLPAALPVAAAIQHVTRKTLLPVASAILGAPLAFDLLEMSTGGVFDWNRFLILAIPFTIILLSSLEHVFRRLGLAIVLACVTGMGVSVWILTGSLTNAPLEYAYHQGVLGKSMGYSTYPLSSAQEVAAWLDSQSLPNGSILIDTFGGFAVPLESEYPQRFVVTPFQGFPEDVYEPYQHGIRYLVVTPPGGLGNLNALNRYYPGLYEGCIDGTQLVLAVDGNAQTGQWRVYRLLQPISPSHLQWDGTCVLPTSTGS